MAKFITGSLVNPFVRSSNEAFSLFESITPIELASAVPFVKIVKIDKRTGAPDTSVRPLMFDLIQGPQFGAMGSQLQFEERSAVSLLSLNIDTKMPIGWILERHVTLEFMVHRPTVVFDRGSKIAWSEIFEEGNSFSLEYGWNGCTGLDGKPSNPLFNGEGFFDRDTGLFIPSTQTVLLVVRSYSTRLHQNGEVGVTINALENGDIALREARLSDSVDEVLKSKGVHFSTSDDAKAAATTLGWLDSVKTSTIAGVGKVWRMGDVLDSVVAPLIDGACRAFGYGGVDLYLGNFNRRAGKQAKGLGGEPMASRSIGEFTINSIAFKKRLAYDKLTKGRALLLRNFVNDLVNTIVGSDNWAASAPNEDVERPDVAVSTRTYRAADGKFRLIFYILDRKQHTRIFNNDPLSEDDVIEPENQTKEAVFKKLNDKRVPIIEFGRGQSTILDASFEIVPNPLFQGILIDTAYRDRKDAQEITSLPDTESRKGKADPKELVPFSTLSGDITFMGNFVIDSFGIVWVEFFGASDISGIFNVMEKHDTLEPGRFVTRVKLVSEGIDPLNTRRKRSAAVRKEKRDKRDELRKGEKGRKKN